MIEWEKARLGRMPASAVWAIRLGFALVVYLLATYRLAPGLPHRPLVALTDDDYLEVRTVVVALLITRLVHLAFELIGGLSARHLITGVDVGWGPIGESATRGGRRWTWHWWPVGVRLSWAVPPGRGHRRRAALLPLSVLAIAAVSLIALIPELPPPYDLPPFDDRLVAATILAYLAGVFVPWPRSPDANLATVRLMTEGAEPTWQSSASRPHARDLQAAVDARDEHRLGQLLVDPASEAIPPHTRAVLAAALATTPGAALARLAPSAIDGVNDPAFAEPYLTALLNAAEAGRPASPDELELARRAVQTIARRLRRAAVAQAVSRFALHDGDPHAAILWGERVLGWTRDPAARGHAQMTMAVAYAQLSWRRQSDAALAKAQRLHPTCSRWPGVNARLAAALAPPNPPAAELL